MNRIRLRRGRGYSAGEAADAVSALAGLLRSGLTVPQALVAWPQRAPPSLRADIGRVARRVRLGAAPTTAVLALSNAMRAEAATMSALLAVHGRLGGDAARMIDVVAVMCSARSRSRVEAAAASAGARLSARMVAGLPLAFVPLTPLSGAFVGDPVGVAALLLGVLLAASGLMWIARLVPRPPPVDATSLVADVLAGVVGGGTGPGAALEVICTRAPQEVRAELDAARRLVRLGAPWPAALRRSGSPGLIDLGGVLERCHALGIPIADGLMAFADERRAAHAAAFQRRLRRAPVLMTLPLTLCVLPAFLLLAVLPAVRALAT